MFCLRIALFAWEEVEVGGGLIDWFGRSSVRSFVRWFVRSFVRWLSLLTELHPRPFNNSETSTAGSSSMFRIIYIYIRSISYSHPFARCHVQHPSTYSISATNPLPSPPLTHSLTPLAPYHTHPMYDTYTIYEREENYTHTEHKQIRPDQLFSFTACSALLTIPIRSFVDSTHRRTRRMRSSTRCWFARAAVCSR